VVLKALPAGKKWLAAIKNVARSLICNRAKFARSAALEIASLAISQWAITDAEKCLLYKHLRLICLAANMFKQPHLVSLLCRIGCRTQVIKMTGSDSAVVAC